MSLLQPGRWARRDAIEHDVTALATLHLATVTVGYAHIFPPEAPGPTLVDLVADWRSALLEPGTTVIVAEADDGLCGSVAIRPDPTEPYRGELRRLHVLPSFWGRGIGADLHDAAVARMRARRWTQASLWVLDANHRARGLYERRGWRLTAERRSPWPDSAVVEVRYERTL